jgi:hypothetical protein
LCGFNTEILKGMSLMAKGFYTSAIRLSREKGVPMDQAMEIEVQEMSIFLTALDGQYAELRKTQPVDVAMRNLAKWTKTYQRESNGSPLKGARHGRAATIRRARARSR